MKITFEDVYDSAPLDMTERELAEFIWETAFTEGVEWAMEQSVDTLNKIQTTLESE